ncbi:MAG TPA: hypothetical protein VF584_21335 [Longimicrobium sp.]|jgi:hypothetical protein
MKTSRLTSILLACMVAGACSPLLSDEERLDAVHVGYVTRSGDMISGTGTVERFDIEGGFFAIRGDDGKVYDPINLPPGFARHGVRVRFTAKLRRDMGSIHMVGEIVEIQQISAA